jgi:uncharacterized protein (TIGR02757 family)
MELSTEKLVQLKAVLDPLVEKYNHIDFIQEDPVSLPHLFKKKQDIEIAGFFAAIFAWGNRPMIIKKTKELLNLMDFAPHDFVLDASFLRSKSIFNFKHRTFNSTDLKGILLFFHAFYLENDSLEYAFFNLNKEPKDVGPYLIHFRKSIAPYCENRTFKHISSPEQHSACKRLNMYLRWMVRDDGEVDFGLWKNIQPAQLICPVDLHVARTVSELRILERKQIDWTYATQLTAILRSLDSKDPVKYDFALFGKSIMP